MDDNKPQINSEENNVLISSDMSKPTETPMTSNSNLVQTEIVTKSKKSKKWLLYLLFIFILIACVGGVYYWQSNIVKNKESQLKEAQEQANSIKSELDTTNAKLKLTALTNQQEVGYTDCTKKDFSNTIFSSLTPEPVAGHQAYVVICLGDGEAVPSLQGLTDTSTGSIIVLKVNDDGTRTFAFGTGTSEPFCISKNIIDATVAEQLATATKLPICKTY